MGKKASKKHSRHRAPKSRQGKTAAMGNEGTISNQATKAMPAEGNKHKNLLHLTLSGVFAFVANLWWIPMLIDRSVVGGYILFLVSNGLLLGWAIYLSVGWLCRKCRFVKFARQIGIASALITFVVFTIFISPLYIDCFAKSQGGIEMPTFVDASTPITVHYGTRADDYFFTQTTVGELLQKGGEVPLRINDQDIFVIHMDGNKLYIDALLFAGIEEENQHVFSPPVEIRNSLIINMPDNWNSYQNNTSLEIQNQDGIPVLILQYKSPYSITISGLFATTFGILKVDNDPNTIYRFGDTPSELGVYKVDRVFIHSFWDLFRAERTYTL